MEVGEDADDRLAACTAAPDNVDPSEQPVLADGYHHHEGEQAQTSATAECALALMNCGEASFEGSSAPSKQLTGVASSCEFGRQSHQPDFAEPKLGTSHVFTCGERRWTYHVAGPHSASPAAQLAVHGHRPISWSFPLPPNHPTNGTKKPSKKKPGGGCSKASGAMAAAGLSQLAHKKGKAPAAQAAPSLHGVDSGVESDAEMSFAEDETTGGWSGGASCPAAGDGAGGAAGDGADGDGADGDGDMDGCVGACGGDPVFSKDLRSAPLVDDPAIAMVCMCSYPGCTKIFAHTDGCRKHARKWHSEWLSNLNKMTQRFYTWEQAWREGLVAYAQAHRNGLPLPLHVLVSPPIFHRDDGDLASSLLSLREPRASGHPKLAQFDPAMGRSIATSNYGPQRGAPPLFVRKHRRQESPGAKAAADAAAQHGGKRAMYAGKPALAGKAASAGIAAASEGRAALPPMKRASIADAAAAARPGAGPAGKSSSQRKRDLRPSGGSSPSTGSETASEPKIRWSNERAAYNAVLPHGASWSMRQIEWFMGTWWKHLANASVATFETSLAHFSAWASDEHGIECLVAWLPKTVELREDLVTLQILELLEYAELQLLPDFHRLMELVRGLETHEDEQVGETAERVTRIFEEILPGGSAPLDAQAASKGRPLVAPKARSHKAPVRMDDDDSIPQPKGRGRSGKRKGRGQPKGAEGLSELRPTAGARAAGSDKSGYGAIDDEYDEQQVGPTGDAGKKGLGCVCGTNRHLQDSPLPFNGVWVQCELCQRWCHGECAGMVTQEQAELAEFFHCSICAPEPSDTESPSSCSRSPAASLWRGGSDAQGRESLETAPSRHAAWPRGSFNLNKARSYQLDARSGKSLSEPLQESDVDEKLWAGAAEQGWRVYCEADSSFSSQLFIFHHEPTGSAFRSRAEAVLHAALEHQRAERLAVEARLSAKGVRSRPDAEERPAKLARKSPLGPAY